MLAVQAVLAMAAHKLKITLNSIKSKKTSPHCNKISLNLYYYNYSRKCIWLVTNSDNILCKFFHMIHVKNVI